MDKKELIKSIKRRIEHYENERKELQDNMIDAIPKFAQLMSIKVVQDIAIIRELKDLLKESEL